MPVLFARRDRRAIAIRRFDTATSVIYFRIAAAAVIIRARRLFCDFAPRLSASIPFNDPEKEKEGDPNNIHHVTPNMRDNECNQLLFGLSIL